MNKAAAFELTIMVSILVGASLVLMTGLVGVFWLAQTLGLH